MLKQFWMWFKGRTKTQIPYCSWISSVWLYSVLTSKELFKLSAPFLIRLFDSNVLDWLVNRSTVGSQTVSRLKHLRIALPHPRNRPGCCLLAPKIYLNGIPQIRSISLMVTRCHGNGLSPQNRGGCHWAFKFFPQQHSLNMYSHVVLVSPFPLYSVLGACHGDDQQ
jgi:hypothetical protein